MQLSGGPPERSPTTNPSWLKIGEPDEKGISEPDLKFFPQFFSKGFGSEVFNAIINYTFENTEAKIIQGTPNKNNIGSQKMQERAGLKKVGEDKYVFPEQACRDE